MTFKGYVIATDTMLPIRRAYVYDAHDWREGKPPVFVAKTIEAAKQWIDAYRRGEQWAVEAHAH